MRRFWSYGPVNSKLHYFAPREDLIKDAYSRLVGGEQEEFGHYITVWAPRQCGKSWCMLNIFRQIKSVGKFDTVKVDLEHLKSVGEISRIIDSISKDIALELKQNIPEIKTVEQFQELFTSRYLKKPLILILDEFDSLGEEIINNLVSVFRNIYNRRQTEMAKPLKEGRYLLHGLALVGVRSVLGVENKKGSPFNVQQNLHIENLSYDEVKRLFRWYEDESGQKVEVEVVEQLYYELRGQPGLTCWFGELLTDTYNKNKSKPITIDNFKAVYAAATKLLPNNNILNIISNAKQDPYKDTVLELFKTDRKIEFNFDNPYLNFLYMNGVIDKDVVDDTEFYVRFASPFVQKRLFNYFTDALFHEMGRLVEPFEGLDDTVTDTELNIQNLAGRYETYLGKNREWLFKDVPRRKDLRIYEAVFHFNFYAYLYQFLKPWKGTVVPEFPTGNGKIDLLITYGCKRYGIELKSYSTEREYKDALMQAARYGKQLKLNEIFLVFFVEAIDSQSREKYQKIFSDAITGVIVKPVFVTTGN